MAHWRKWSSWDHCSKGSYHANTEGETWNSLNEIHGIYDFGRVKQLVCGLWNAFKVHDDLCCRGKLSKMKLFWNLLLKKNSKQESMHSFELPVALSYYFYFISVYIVLLCKSIKLCHIKYIHRVLKNMISCWGSGTRL